MNLTRTMTDLGNLYEEKVTTPRDTFETVKGDSSAKSKKAPYVETKKGPKSGPENADGFKTDEADPKTSKKSGVEKFSQKSKKTVKENINNFMNKSIFDELFEAVMGEEGLDAETHDAEALGLPTDDKSAEGEGDEVTITLSKELAGKLHEALAAVLESEGKSDETADDTAGDDLGDDSEDQDEQTFGEATDIQELGDKSAALKGKNNKVAGDASEVDGKEGDGDSAGIVNDGKPQALKKNVGGGVPSNKVASKVTSGVKKNLFSAAK